MKKKFVKNKEQCIVWSLFNLTCITFAIDYNE